MEEHPMTLSEIENLMTAQQYRDYKLYMQSAIKVDTKLFAEAYGFTDLDKWLSDGIDGPVYIIMLGVCRSKRRTDILFANYKENCVTLYTKNSISSMELDKWEKYEHLLKIKHRKEKLIKLRGEETR